MCPFNYRMSGSRSRAILIGCLIGGGCATAVILLTITLVCRHRQNRNMAPRTTGNTLKRPPPKFHQKALVEPFMGQYPMNQHLPSSDSTQALFHRRSTSAASHQSTSKSSVVLSVAAPATVGVSEDEPTRNTLADAREEERFARRVRKFRDQVADLRRWAEQSRFSTSGRPSPVLDII